MQIPVVGEQLQTLFGKPHVEGALTGDQAGCRTFWTGFTWHVWKIKTMLKKGFQIRIQIKRCGGNSKFSHLVAGCPTHWGSGRCWCRSQCCRHRRPPGSHRSLWPTGWGRASCRPCPTRNMAPGHSIHSSFNTSLLIFNKGIFDIHLSTMSWAAVLAMVRRGRQNKLN